MSAPLPVTPRPALPLLWCQTCNRAAGGTDADWKRYERDGWPTCCGRLMACYAPSLPVVDLSHRWECVGGVEGEREPLSE